MMKNTLDDIMIVGDELRNNSQSDPAPISNRTSTCVSENNSLLQNQPKTIVNSPSGTSDLILLGTGSSTSTIKNFRS